MFRVTARTILELGSELISSDVIAFYELIKNGFDAQTKSGVEVRFDVVLRKNAFLSLQRLAEGTTEEPSAPLDVLKEELTKAINNDATPDLVERARSLTHSVTSVPGFTEALTKIYRSSTIVVADTGSGMSQGDLTSTFLVIGTPSRKQKVDQALARGDKRSPFLGEKGIGRLSAMRLGGQLRVETARANDSHFNLLEINWSDFANLDAMLDDIEVSPQSGDLKPDPEWSGTNIIIGDLAEDWTKERLTRMAVTDFARWTDPFIDQRQRPRVVFFWNGERVVIPWLDRRLIDQAHAKVEGSYIVDEEGPRLKCTITAYRLGFEHPPETETVVVPSVDLEGLLAGPGQEIYDEALKSVGSFDFEVYWYNRRILTAIDGLGETKAVKQLQERWSGILLFRDNFRVFPYGDDQDDWLALDRKALQRSGYTLNKTQFIGRVQISRTKNPFLVDQTNREGLRETPEQQVLVGIMQFVIQRQLFQFIKNVERQYKQQKLDFSEAKSEVSHLEQRANTALKRLAKLAPPESRSTVSELQETMAEFTEFAERARERISQVEQESRQMIEMAGVGLMVEIVAHELARASENALENLEHLRGRTLPDDVRAQLDGLRAQMKSLSKRLKVLDPLSVSGRQRVETFNLDDLIRDTLEAHQAQFERHRIEPHFKVTRSPLKIRAVKGMVVQIVENLLSNSKYWLDMRASREPAFKPKINIELTDDPPTLVYEDNGQGIAPDNREKIFRVFFSLKERTQRRGLGLYIARACAEFIGGTLVLDEHVNPETSRLHRFVLELPQSGVTR